MDPEKLKNISNSAVAAFWKIVKTNAPHTLTQEVDPSLARALAEAAERAVLDWGEKNDRDPWTDVGSVIRLTFKDDPERQFAFVWDSDHNSFRTWAMVRPLNWELRHYREGYSQPGVVDPGLVRLEFNQGTWSWVAEDKTRIPVEIEHCHEGEFRSSFLDPADRKVLVVSEIICNTEPELMRIKLPENLEQSIVARISVRRLIGELNMVYHALMHG